MVLVQTEPKKIYISLEANPLCFTANAASSTVKLRKFWSPTSVTLETSTDGENWSTYTFGNTITLANIGDKVYFRNTSETTTWFSTSTSASYKFEMTWSVAWSWDINYLINKNSTDTLVWNYCYYYLFADCTSLTTAPKLPATTLTEHCYQNMFYNCTNLETLTALPATTLTEACYNFMFGSCSKIKISTTQTWEYQNEYRIPTTWTWTTASYALNYMFNSTWWTFTSNPSINTIYYTSNTLV